MDVQTAAAAFAALSSAPRLAIYRLLAETGPLTAGELARAVGVAPPNVTFHCRTLCLAGLVSFVRRGRQVWYTADVEKGAALLGWLGETCRGERIPQRTGEDEAVTPRRRVW